MIIYIYTKRIGIQSAACSALLQKFIQAARMCILCGAIRMYILCDTVRFIVNNIREEKRDEQKAIIQ
jgi:hypothetical protein